MELFPSRTPSIKRPLEDSDGTSLQESKRPHLQTTPLRRGYQRHPKPPYKYVGMMTVAIHTSPSRRLALPEIQEALEDMFPFFRGQYTGWRDSVRHFLSSLPCFVKISRDQSSKKATKGNYWGVDLSRVPTDAFKRLKVKPEMEATWARTLTEQLKIPDIVLPPSSDPPRRVVRELKKSTANSSRAGCRRSQSSDKEGPSDVPGAPAPSLSYTEAQYTRYLREQTPPDTRIRLNQYPPFASLLYQTTTSFDYTEAASNLQRLCPEPEYGSPTSVPRDLNAHETTPTVRKALTFDTPEPVQPVSQTISVPGESSDSSLSELTAFFMNFANSLTDVETFTQPDGVQHHVKEEPTSPSPLLTSLQSYHTSSQLTVQHVEQATPTNASLPVPSIDQGETTSHPNLQLQILSFNDLPLSPDAAYNYF